ncbi:ankyrin [Viridothelium virens]|uniref:Ankyrin n=1 Tax=Viridothelium virens TaxID=1048519 RepID=A0A6A6H7W2_VIRVR|nr:ankyrin [Viridothelium virens]
MIDPSARLRRAILLRDLELVERIVRNNHDLIQNPDFEDKSNTSLHLAAREGSVEIADFLIRAGHEDSCISRNADGDTPLMVAAASEKVEVGELLIRHFPRCVSWQNKAGCDALMLSARHEPSTPLISTLLSAPLISAFPSPSTSPSQSPVPSNPLSRPAASSDPTVAAAAAATTTTKHPYPHPLVLQRDNEGSTALHHASAAGSLKALRLLLFAGANPRETNAFAWDPMQYSASVAAEVYFKNLVAEMERRRGEAAAAADAERRGVGAGAGPASVLGGQGALGMQLQQAMQGMQGQQGQQGQEGGGAGGRRLVGGGVRLVTEGLDAGAGGGGGGGLVGAEEVGGVPVGLPPPPGKSWSPVERKGPGTPTTASSAKTTDWRFVQQPGSATRGRAGSGE